MSVKEFNHSFTDAEGNVLAYLHVVSAEHGEGIVRLQFAEEKDQYTIDNCKHLAQMLHIDYVVEDKKNIMFKTHDGITTAMVLTRDLESNNIIGEGALKELEKELKKGGYLQPMDLALHQASPHVEIVSRMITGQEDQSRSFVDSQPNLATIQEKPTIKI